MNQAWQIGGSLMILAAFVLSQMGRLSARSLPFLILNAAGGSILAVDAYLGQEWGFLLLEGFWTLVSAYGLCTRVRSIREPRPLHAPHQLPPSSADSHVA